MSNSTTKKGKDGGAWDQATHEQLYGPNLNTGLGEFLVEHITPKNFLEIGSGLGALANYVAQRTPLFQSYCLEPEITPSRPSPTNLHFLNINILSDTAPGVLDRLFDLVISIEVAEHIPLSAHKALFDFIVSRAGRLIVFSGARPGQGGHGHIAERHQLEWRRELTSRGCRFDPKLTLLARNMSNKRNINHRNNLQVFHAPHRSPLLSSIEASAQPYLRDLLILILRNGGQFTGNLFYVDLSDAISGRPVHSLHWKRENLAQLASLAHNILEIGFGAGHSALLCLLANPNSSLTIVDPFHFAHARDCANYLSAMFPGRITFMEGLSPDALESLPTNFFDLVHLDGGKNKTIADDLNALKDIVSRDHVLCIDDTQNPGVLSEIHSKLADSELEISAFKLLNTRSQRSEWTHCIARFADGRFQDVDVILTELRQIYAQIEFPSIYIQPNSPARARAEYLVNAIRDIESKGLKGAFVEIGVAAGHSSVIAALARSRQFPRDFYLYDTFEGFSENLPDEIDHNGRSIREYDLNKYKGIHCSEQSVRARLLSAGLAFGQLFLVKGEAEDTIPSIQPPRIAILRLDADLLAPTYAALHHLYDLVEPGGYVIVDDYGHWRGCAEAVERFFSKRNESFPGKQIDYTCYGWKV